MLINIRSAKIEDSIQLLPLMEQMGYPQTLETMKDRLNAYLNIPYHYAFVADCGSKIVGILTMGCVEAFVYSGRGFRITTMVVDEKYRGQGIGRKLMDHAEIFAKAHGGTLIDLTSGLRRAKDGSHEFYKSLGYRNEGLMAKLYLRKELR